MLTCSEVYHGLLYFKINGFTSALAVLYNSKLEEKNLKKLSSWCKRLQKSDLYHKIVEFQWRIFHKALYTNVRFYEIDPHFDKTSEVCGIADEGFEHIFVKCVIARTFGIGLMSTLGATIT